MLLSITSTPDFRNLRTHARPRHCIYADWAWSKSQVDSAAWIRHHLPGRAYCSSIADNGLCDLACSNRAEWALCASSPVRAANCKSLVALLFYLGPPRCRCRVRSLSSLCDGVDWKLAVAGLSPPSRKPRMQNSYLHLRRSPSKRYWRSDDPGTITFIITVAERERERERERESHVC